MVHIATTDTFFVDAIQFEASKCLICQQVATSEAGWIGIRCHLCRQVWDSDMWCGLIARRRREVMNLTRRQIAEKAGLKPSTIKRYEFVEISKAYYDFTAKLIQSHYSTPPLPTTGTGDIT